MTVTTELASNDALDRGNISESHLRNLDILGYIVAAIITLGPLAATAAFG